jgi:hypothetical protein
MNDELELYAVRKCLYCDGLQYTCKMYQPFWLEIGDTCVWYKAVDSDLDKIRKGETNLTFSGLAEIIKNEYKRI